MKSMSYFYERTHGIEDLGCEIVMVVGHQCIVKVVLKILERIKCYYVYVKSTVMNTNW